MSDPHVSSMTPNKKDKICLVCGDRALGYNFNAISCESCKAFFRRNAHKTIRGRCEGKCDITIESRSFCKRCRQAKCFSVGMRKDMILSDDQKKIRKQKIIFNKLRRQGHILPDEQFIFDEVTPEPKDENENSNSNSNPQTLIKPEKIESPCSSMEESTNKSRKRSWSESQDDVKFVISSLPEHEQQLLEELLQAHEASAFLTCTSTILEKAPSNPTEFANIAEGFVRRIIKVTKNVSNFKKLCKDDQICLLKGAVVDVMMLRSAVNYDPATESWSLSTMSCLQKPKSGGSSPSPFSGLASAMSLSNGMSLPSGMSSPEGMSKPNGFSLPEGMSLPSGFSLPKGISLPSGFSLPEGVSLPSGMSSPSSMPSPSGISSPSGMSSPDGMSSPSGLPKDLAKLAGLAGLGGNSGASGVNRISADLLKLGGKETMEMFKYYSKFIKSLMTTIRGDLVVLKILIMMAIFSTDRGELTDHDFVQKSQEEYAEILQKYIQLRFPEEKTLFAQVLMTLTDLRNINDVHTKMLLKMKLDDVEPLLLEIFDLPST